MPTRAQILHATPTCDRSRPCKNTNGTFGYTPCREFLKWKHDQGAWACRHHGNVLSMQMAAERLKVPA